MGQTADGEEERRGTALITGASSGIGESFARQLAERGYDLILVARRRERLEALAADLDLCFRVKVEVLAADLSDFAGINQVEQRILACPDLSLLINNAGFSVKGDFSRASADRQTEMVTVHVTAPVRLILAALPGMKTRRAGGIINVSSVAGFFPVAGGNYAATKAYLNALTEALAGELRGAGVKVQALCPGFTVTGFHSTHDYEGIDIYARIPSFLWMKADDVVSASLRALDRGNVYCVPGLIYKFGTFLGRTGIVGLPLAGLARRLRGNK